MNTGYMLSQVENSRPIRQYRYKALINSIIDELKNRKFKYDASDDPEYRRLSQRYMHRARRAMEDTLAQGMALSGSRLNSFAQGLAQQRYNESLANIDAIIPALSKIALDKFNADGKGITDRLDSLKSLDNLEQRDYENILSSWQKDRDYYLKKYNAELARTSQNTKHGSRSRKKSKKRSTKSVLSLKRIIKGQKIA